MHYELIYKCKDYCVLRVLTYQGVLRYSRHTNWCCNLLSRYTNYLGESLYYRVLFKDKISMRLTIPKGITQVKEISFGLGGKNDHTKVGMPLCKDSVDYDSLDDRQKFYYYQQISPRYADIFKFDKKDYGNRNELIKRINIVNDNIIAKNLILQNIKDNS